MWKKVQKIEQTQNWYQSTEIAHHNAWSLELIFSSTVNRHHDLFICFAEVLQKHPLTKVSGTTFKIRFIYT